MPFIDVPGFGRFDPYIPSWLELRPDGKLYNKNAADKNRVWDVPAGWRGGVGESGPYTFTPEAELPQPAPAPTPAPTLSEPTKAAIAQQRAAVALAEASLEADQKYLDAQKALVAAARSLVDKYEADLTAALGK
jgi:hypothetical protein